MSSATDAAPRSQVSSEDFAEILRATREFVRERVVPRETEILERDEIPADIQVLLGFGTDEQRSARFGRIASGEVVASFALTGPGAGSRRASRSPVERIHRDVRLLRLYDGTSEIQRLIIGGGLVKTASRPWSDGLRRVGSVADARPAEVGRAVVPRSRC